jgi:hypothetical protein
LAWKYSDDIIHRKLAYLAKLASVEGIDLSMDKWLANLTEIQTEISYDVIYRLLNELYLVINTGLDSDDFDYPPLPPDFDPPHVVDPPIEGGTKAYYDVTYYDTSYFDPPEVGFKDLERYAWANRYRISEKDVYAYKKQSGSLVDLIAARRSGMAAAGVSDHYLDTVETTLSMVESRILKGLYVGFIVVGLNRVPKAHPAGVPYRTTVEARHRSDWKTLHNTESVLSWESLVDWSHVGYARVGAWYMVMNKTVSDMAVQRINDFWERTGLVPTGVLSQYGGIGYAPSYGQYVEAARKTLYQRIFMYQRVDQYHYKGGAEQLKMQFNFKRIAPILDRNGVIANFRMAYTSFANEVYYLDYDSHRLYKLWRKLITKEDIVDKYVKLGCDRNILNQIMYMVKP